MGPGRMLTHTHTHTRVPSVSEKDLRGRHTGRQVTPFQALNPHTGREEVAPGLHQVCPDTAVDGHSQRLQVGRKGKGL